MIIFILSVVGLAVVGWLAMFLMINIYGLMTEK
jgi:hypothetical protein